MDIHTTDTATLEELAQHLRSGIVSNSRQLGMLGERYAALWLESRGWRVLDRNWRTRFGELDIVAFSPDGVVVFVEVKTRRSLRCGLPQEAVGLRKQVSVRRVGAQWLLDPVHRVVRRGVRFDVISIVVGPSGPLLCHIPGAF